jgi:hypothetical protein
MLTQEEQYYENGYFVGKLPKELQSLIWNEIYSTDWINDNVENIYKSIPSWYERTKKYNLDPTGSNRAQFEREIGKDVFEHTPDNLKLIAKDVIKLHKFFNRYYNSSTLEYIDMWNGSEEIPYHYDTINGADTLILIYITDEPIWLKEWGGQISLKKQVGDVILIEEEIDPVSGTMIVINNANPLLKHKVRKLLNPEVNRYTFSFSYKWK